jgi:hypothetical protein
MRIADYFIPPDNTTRAYGVAGAAIPTMHLAFEYQPGPGAASWRINQTGPLGEWDSDWLLREGTDGSLIEYGDEYPAAKIDWPRSRSRLTFISGHEIRWAEDAKGTLWPNFLKTSPSKFGSFGTYLCKVLVEKDGAASIYMEQTFGHTDRSVFHCRKGHGIFAIDYYYTPPSGGTEFITLHES